MIFQNLLTGAPENAPCFVQKNVEHEALAGQFAKIFGNERFEPLDPAQEMLYLVAHHDYGWHDLDEDPPLDPESGLPYHLGSTPIDSLLRTIKGSPDHNEQYHPYCGLLSSMHSYGLYHGRYGLSEVNVLEMIPEAGRPRVAAMLDNELVRQDRLKVELAGNPFAESERLFHNYKLLQFFDTISLYFNISPPGERAENDFSNVPMTLGKDVTISVTEVEAGIYAFAPFPFRDSGVDVYCEGRYLAPNTLAESGAALMASQPVERQYFKLIAG